MLGNPTSQILTLSLGSRWMSGFTLASRPYRSGLRINPMMYALFDSRRCVEFKLGDIE
jgi:hypothetical protein